MAGLVINKIDHLKYEVLDHTTTGSDPTSSVSGLKQPGQIHIRHFHPAEGAPTMLELIGFSLADVHLAYKFYKKLRSRKIISSADMSRNIEKALNNHDFAIRIHILKGSEAADDSFQKAIDQKDIPDYTILLNPDHNLKQRIKKQMFSSSGAYGKPENSNFFETSELRIIPGGTFGYSFSSLYIVGQMQNKHDSESYFEFMKLPIEEIHIKNSYIVEHRRDEEITHEISTEKAKQYLLKLTQQINNNNSTHIGVRSTQNDTYGNSTKTFDALL